MPLSGSRPLVPERTLSDVAAWLGADLPGRAAGSVPVSGVTLDSRHVEPGDLYAALPGSRTHGASFAGDAMARGAVAILTDHGGAPAAAEAGIPVLVVADPRAVLGELSAWMAGEPARHLLMLGVTGTNGKTTTTYLLDAALRRAGRLTGLVGTVETRVGDERMPSVRTTPEAPQLQALLALMVRRDVSVCSMEVSSHALALHRVDGIAFDVAGFTNLSQDHLDFHASMEEYFAAKAALFVPSRARTAVICIDDPWGRRLARESTIPVVTLATHPDAGDDVRAADWRLERSEPHGAGTSFTLLGPRGDRLIARSPLPGEFNVANTALALLILVSAGFDGIQAAGWLADAGPVPGRMERVGAAPGSGTVTGEPLAVVDYAHSPDAVAAALTALRSGTPGRLVVVLGAGGDRDRQKRPRMGAAAAGAADVVIVTDDNPRSEDPATIRSAVLAGAREAAALSGADVLEVADRRAAIAEAVRRAWGSGTVLVAGKGHESGQEVAGTVHPFDDRQVLAEALAEAAAGLGPALR